MGKRIMVVDDEPDVVDFLESLLRDEGYEVSSTTRSTEALAMLEASPPDLLLLDLQMPSETGTDLYRRIRDSKTLRRLPIIVVSGLAGRRVAVSKNVPVIDKPIDEQRLLAEVERALGL